MLSDWAARLEDSASQLVGAIGDFSDVTVFRSWGNRGDDLIYAGMRRLLCRFPYREFDIRDLDKVSPGQTAVISGGGSWCQPFHELPGFLPEVERRFSRVILFPSSFDIAEPVVRQVLSRTRALVYARERQSYEMVRGLCEARLAHDTAFFFDFDPYRNGFSRGVLNAFRCDREATGAPIPEDNRDISAECGTLDEWLWTISRHQVIRTDRAHVLIAAAMLGKRVEFRPSNYHKLPAIVEFSLPAGLVQSLASSRSASPT